ncbi:unnamed protein product [Orchesella dallaii]|uniref:BTB domain-containing protein n=1 Tax=Orchesella dallaii TaxID=48710 RepID=A0ABP1REI2_9HEXA
MFRRRRRTNTHNVPEIGMAKGPQNVPLCYNMVANLQRKTATADIQTRLPPPRTRFRFRRFAQHRPPPQGPIVNEVARPLQDLYPIGQCGAVKEVKVASLEDDFSECFVCFQTPINRGYYEKQHKKIIGSSDPNTNRSVCFPGRQFRVIVQKSKVGGPEPYVLLAFNICTCKDCMTHVQLISRQLGPVTVKFEVDITVEPNTRTPATENLSLDFYPGCTSEYDMDKDYKANAKYLYYYYYGPMSTTIIDGFKKIAARQGPVPTPPPAQPANRPNPVPNPNGLPLPNRPAIAGANANVVPNRPAPVVPVRAPPTFTSPGHQRTIRIISITPKPTTAPCDFNYFRKIYDMKEETDVDVMSSDGKVFKCHRIVLMTRCEAFSRLLPHKTAAEGKIRQTLKLDEDANVVEAFLLFIYKNDTSRISADLRAAVGCIRLANQYNIQDLSASACDLLIKRVENGEWIDQAELYELYNYVHLVETVEIVVELKWTIINNVRKTLLETKNKRVKVAEEKENDVLKTTFGLEEDVRDFMLDLMRTCRE